MPEIDGYSNLARIAKGGFGVVYRATQDRFGRSVALKVLDTEELDEKARRRFERECLAMGRLSWHPNVVAVFDSGITEAGQPYLVMEYLEGGSLGDRLRTAPLKWDEVVRVGVQMAGALAAAHRVGTLHRDLKPENILIGPFGESKLADFGIAAIQGSTRTTVGHASFTVAHVAPEVLQGVRPDERSDLYGLGTTLHRLVVGSPPFAGDPSEPFVAMMARVINEPAPRLTDVPTDLADVLERTLAKDPADRPHSAVELGELLQGIEAAEGIPVTEMRIAPISSHAVRPVAPIADPEATRLRTPTGDARPTVYAPVNQGANVASMAEQDTEQEPTTAVSVAPTEPVSRHSGAVTPGSGGSGGGYSGWWLAGVIGVMVIAGSFLPFLSAEGESATLASPPMSALSYLALGALLIVGSITSRGSRVGTALAGGAALTFVASYAGVLSSVISVMDAAHGSGVDVTPQVGFFVLALAALGSTAVLATALTSLRGPFLARWPFVLGAIGFGLLLVGLVVPRSGLDAGEHLFLGDGWSDAAGVLLLLSVGLVAVLLIVTPTSETGAFALGAGTAWFVSWCVFAFNGSSGGLPVPFPGLPILGGVAFGLMSATVAAALWWTASATVPTVGGALAGARVAVIILCGATSVIAVGGAAAADEPTTASLAGGFPSSSFRTALTSSAGSSSAFGESSDGSFDSSSEPPPPVTEASVPVTEAFVPEPTTVQCVEAFCQSHPSLPPVVDELIDSSGARDLALTGSGQWIAQVQANSVTASEQQLRDAYNSLSAAVPDLRVVYSDDFASMPIGYVIFFNAGPFASGEAAAAYCSEIGRNDRELCFGRLMSNDPADNDAYVYP